MFWNIIFPPYGEYYVTPANVLQNVTNMEKKFILVMW